MPSQLYSFTKSIETPEVLRFNSRTGEVYGSSRDYTSAYAFRWPDGRPCVPVELYLYEMTKHVAFSNEDGGTVGVYATHLTHLVRFCYDEGVDFGNLVTKDIDNLVFKLCGEVDEFGDRLRNNNTVETIVADSVRFLFWLKNNMLLDVDLIGVNDQKVRYQIGLIEFRYSDNNGRVHTGQKFPARLPSSPVRAKTPIASNIIGRLWDTLHATKNSDSLNKMLESKYTEQQKKDHIEYMYQRRKMQLRLLEATGLRPGELVGIRFRSNNICLEENKLEIPTLKRRDDKKYRVIPIEHGLAMELEVYAGKYRQRLVTRLVRTGLLSSVDEADDVLYLDPQTGKRVLSDTARKDFSRLAKRAGIRQKTCQSMFRHRFVTTMVKLHLIAFMDKNPLKSRHLMTESDVDSILKKVADFTGHKQIASLNFYLDLAWEELDVFAYTNEVVGLQDALRHLGVELGGIVADLQNSSDRVGPKALQVLVEKLKKMEKFAMSSGAGLLAARDN